MGGFSLPPLAKLIEVQVEVVAVIVPSTATSLGATPQQLVPRPPPVSDVPLLNPHLNANIIHLAWRHNIPVWAVDNLQQSSTLSFLADLQPDLLVVVCFSLMFPPVLLNLPRFGCWNLHPSLLPAYRGPAPLFWQAQQGESEVGVTLHLLDEGMDSGDIVSQHSWPWPEGITEGALDQQCAQLGGDLLEAALKQLEQTPSLPRQPQAHDKATYFPWPGEADFRIPVTWSARRAFNFLRFGLPTWPLWIEVEENRFLSAKPSGMT